MHRTLRLLIVSAGLLAAAAAAAGDPAWLRDLRARHAAGQWNRTDSLATVTLAQAERQPGRDSLWLAEGLDLLVRAAQLTRSADSAMVAGAERALGLRRRHLGEDARETARSLELWGTLAWLRGDRTNGAAAIERAFPAIERGYGPASEQAAASALTRATVLIAAGRHAFADSLLQRGLAVCSTGVVGPSTHGLLLLSRSYALRGTGRNDEALEACRRAVALFERAPGSRGRDLARGLVAYGNQLYDASRYAEAESLESRGAAAMDVAFGRDHPDACTAWKNYANTLSYTRGPEAARAIYEQVAAVETAAGPARRVSLSITLVNLGQVLFEEGDYAGARRVHERAAELREQALGPQHPRLAVALGVLAEDVAALGEPDEALRLLDRALAIRRGANGPDHVETARVRFTRAGVLLAAGRPAAAVADAAAACSTFAAKLEPDHFELAQARAALGRAEWSLGRAARAESLFALALPVYERALAAEHSLTATLLRERGEALAALGDTARAGASLRRALAMSEAVLGHEHPQRAAILLAQAGLARRAGDARAALALALEAERVGREHARLAARSLSEREAVRFSAVRTAGLGLALDVALAADSLAADQAWAAVASSRGLVLDALASRRRAAARAGSGVAAPAAEYEAASREYAHALVASGADAAGDARRRLEQARARRESAERALAARAADAFAPAGGGADVRAALPADAALVSYARWRGEAGERLAAFVVRPGRAAIAVPLGAAAAVDARVAAWRRELTSEPPAGAAGAAALRRCDAAGLAVRRAVWDPVAAHLGGVARVFVVPEGSLHLVPFAALPVAPGRWLVDDARALHVLACERDLLHPHAPTAARTLLAFGGPAFDTLAAAPAGEPLAVATRGTEPCAEFRDVRFEALPAAADEARGVAAIAAEAGWSDVQVLTGAAASESAFKRRAPAASVLHLATHGFFVAGDCVRAGRGTRGIGASTPAGRPRPVADAEPDAETDAFQLAGLALAGANQRAHTPAGAEDGVLTAEEIAAMDLGGVDWAVLSACDTGVGPVAVGEGVFGLRRAFEAAGVRATVLSLWEVEDETARTWAAALYRARWRDGRSTSDAVREAARALLAARRAHGVPHPWHWAAFVATGDWR